MEEGLPDKLQLFVEDKTTVRTAVPKQEGNGRRNTLNPLSLSSLRCPAKTFLWPKLTAKAEDKTACVMQSTGVSFPGHREQQTVNLGGRDSKD